MAKQPESRLVKQLLHPGRETLPAGYSFLTRKCEREERVRIVKYLIGCRDAILTDLGGEENLSAQKLILIDRLISLLGVVRGIEEFHRESIMDKDGNVKNALCKTYLSYVNSCRLMLTTLGLERHTMLDPTKDLLDRMAKFDADKAREDEEKAKETAHKQGKTRPKVRHSLPTTSNPQGERTG